MKTYLTSRILGEEFTPPGARPPTDEELNVPPAAYFYAKNVVRGRWPEGEEAIKKAPGWAYMYAFYILKQPWPEAEPFVANDANASAAYAIDVLRKRWPEMEREISKTDMRNAYLRAFQDAKDDWITNGWEDWLSD